MLDIGWSELLVIGVVALIVVGPKDLPHLFHSLGRLTAKARSMAREFTSAMEEAAKDSGVDEAASSIREVKSLTSKKSLGLDALDRATERFEKWDPGRPDSKPRRDPGQDAKPASAGETPASAPPADTDTSDEAPGKRRLHAVRRSDMKDD